MTKLLEIKDQLIRFYSKYETYLYPIVKFAVALALFTVINTNIGYCWRLSVPFCRPVPYYGLAQLWCLRICMRFPWK